MGKDVVWVGAMLAIGLGLGGCGLGHETPEDAFRALQESIVERDWRRTLNAMTPDSRDKCVGSIVFAYQIAAIVDGESKTLLDRHGFDRAKLTGPAAEGQSQGGLLDSLKANLDVERYANTVNDKHAFFADVMNQEKGIASEAGQRLQAVAGATLGDVRIEGETATGRVKLADGPGLPISFRRQTGGWLIDLF